VRFGAAVKGLAKVTKVLIVDDEPSIRELLRTAFQTRGYEVAEAENGEAALAQYAAFRPSVIVMDLIMPGMEGIEAIRHLRKTDSKVHIIALSGGGNLGFVDYLKYAEQLGADLAMSKPIALKDLLGNVEKLLSEAPPAAG
jgi:two-component system response regulator (stage 0 sporulation protein F)